MKTLPISRGLSVLVDDDVFEWFAGSGRSGKFYAARTVQIDGKRSTVYLHRLIAGVDGLDVDHVNGDTLDNQRSNLKPSTHQDNQRNRRVGYGTTGVRNVYLTRAGTYQARLSPKSGPICGGTFASVAEAAVSAAILRRTCYGEP